MINIFVIGSDPMEVDKISDKIPDSTPKKWVFSGFYPFPNKEMINELSKLHNQPIFRIDKKVVGIILLYPHGFDSNISDVLTSDNPRLNYQYEGYDSKEFLHIFNYGKRRDNIVGVSKCVKYETGLLPSMKRISFTLEPI